MTLIHFPLEKINKKKLVAKKMRQTTPIIGEKKINNVSTYNKIYSLIVLFHGSLHK